MTSIFLADCWCEGVDCKSNFNLFYFDLKNTSVSQAVFEPLRSQKMNQTALAFKKHIILFKVSLSSEDKEKQLASIEGINHYQDGTSFSSLPPVHAY